MTAPNELMTYVDRSGYERACAELGIDAFPDHETAAMAETGFERLHTLAGLGARMSERAALATHLRRGWSVHSGLPESTPVGTALLGD